MIKQLIKLANHLDKKGLQKEADYLDAVISKLAREGRPNHIQKEDELREEMDDPYIRLSDDEGSYSTVHISQIDPITGRYKPLGHPDRIKPELTFPEDHPINKNRYRPKIVPDRESFELPEDPLFPRESNVDLDDDGIRDSDL